MAHDVARELEQAEARLAELQSWLEAKIATRHSVALRDVLTTAIEVGRLRALVPSSAPPQWSAEQITFLNEHIREQLRLIRAFADHMLGDITVDTHALAARKEVQGG